MFNYPGFGIPLRLLLCPPFAPLMISGIFSSCEQLAGSSRDFQGIADDGSKFF